MLIKADRAQSPSRHVLTRSKTMRIERIAPTEFKVTPAEKGKSVRIVRFHQDEQSYSNEQSVWIDCFDAETKEGCPANEAGRYCSHAEAAIVGLLENAGLDPHAYCDHCRNVIEIEEGLDPDLFTICMKCEAEGHHGGICGPCKKENECQQQQNQR